ncbi:MAG TPA: hypothetical protein VFV38_46135 [Ktedonobacteraceae bacterium]|nr:hypothetical protein [Ktedonobacteraceae bacterium]
MKGLIQLEARIGRQAYRLWRFRLVLLFLVSMGLLGVLVGMRVQSVSFPLSFGVQGSGKGAGGIATNATLPSTPAASCWPTDTSCIINSVASQIAAGIQAAFQPITDGILKNPADILYQTPLLNNGNEAQNQAILSLNAFFVNVVDIAFACLILIAGYNVIIGRHLLIPSSTIMEILPRVVLVMVAVHFNIFFLSLFVDFENALSQAVIQIAGLDMLTNLIAGLFTAQDLGLLTFLLIVVLGVMAIMLLIQMVTRIALVALSLALAPLGLGCFFLPQTIRWGRLWLVTLSTSMMVQFIQVTALGLGGVFISAIAATSFLRIDKSLAIAFLAIGTLGLVLKIPGMLQTWALHPMMDSSGSGGGSGTQGDTTYGTPGMPGAGSGGSSGGTTVSEAGASGGTMEGTMLAEESGALLLMF